MVTAAVGTLSVWMRAYLAFSLPQLIALIVMYTLSGSIFTVISISVYTWFMLTVAKNFNTKFKEGRLLIDENIKLITQMKEEISARKTVQSEIENQQRKLEDKINERTLALENTNESFNDQIGIRRVVEKQLEYLADYDELIKLPKRTLFIEDIKKSLHQAKRNDSLLGVLFIDLDRFKNINDSYGHAIGDEVIKIICKIIKGSLSDKAIFARLGGEEFSILCHSTSKETVIQMMEDIRKKIKTIEVIADNKESVKFTISEGVSKAKDDTKNIDELLKEADKALYEAKDSGRNRVVFRD